MIQSIFAPLMLTAALGMANQSPRADSGNGTVFDAQFSSLIQEAMDANNITGMAVGVLLPDGGVEFGAWGNRTENGEKIAPDVCFVPLIQCRGPIMHTDHLRLRLIIKGIFVCIAGYPHAGLRDWEERDSSPVWRH